MPRTCHGGATAAFHLPALSHAGWLLHPQCNVCRADQRARLQHLDSVLFLATSNCIVTIRLWLRQRLLWGPRPQPCNAANAGCCCVSAFPPTRSLAPWCSPIGVAANQAAIAPRAPAIRSTHSPLWWTAKSMSSPFPLSGSMLSARRSTPAAAARTPLPSCLPSTLNCSCSPANSGGGMLRPRTVGVKGEGHGAAAPVSAGTGGTTATAPARRSAVALRVAGARSGIGVQATDVGGPTTQGQHGGGRGPRHGAGVPAMRPAHELSRCSSGFLAGALGATAGLSGTVPLLGVQTGTPALVGSSGRGAGAHLWFFGSSVGTAGRGGAVCTGGAAGTVALGSDASAPWVCGGWHSDWDRRRPTTARL